MLDNYKRCELIFATARSKAVGKPLAQSFILKKVGDNFTLNTRGYHGDHELAHITPDNILTVDFDWTTHSGLKHMLSQGLSKYLPVEYGRASNGRYRIEHKSVFEERPASRSLRYPHWERHAAFLKDGPEYFPGIQFNLMTGECLNRRPDETDMVDIEARREWLRAIRKFKRGMRTRIKVNAMQGIVDKVGKQREQLHQEKEWGELNALRPVWADTKWNDLLYKSIKDNDYPMELLEGVIQSIYSYHRRHMDIPNERIEAELNRICDSQSITLRRRFGVFEQSTSE